MYFTIDSAYTVTIVTLLCGLYRHVQKAEFPCSLCTGRYSTMVRMQMLCWKFLTFNIRCGSQVECRYNSIALHHLLITGVRNVVIDGCGTAKIICADSTTVATGLIILQARSSGPCLGARLLHDAPILREPLTM